MNTALLLSSFIAGILTVLAPCVLTLLPVIIGSSAGSNDPRKPFIVTISLGVSIVVFTLLLKASTLLISVPQSFWSILSGSIIIIFGIFLLFPEVWDSISTKLKLSNNSHQLLDKAEKKDSIFGAILIGAALGPVFSSCSPTYFLILATVLPVSFFEGLIYLLVYALGLSFILGIIGYFGQKIIAKLKWASNPNGIFKKLMGLLLVLVGIFVITGYDKYIESKILSSDYNVGNLESNILETPTINKYQDYTEIRKKNAKLDGKNYALFFHADWCSTCHDLENSIKENITVLPENSVVFKVDYDKEQGLKQKYDVLTQTTVLFFDSEGNLIDRKINPDIDRIVKSLSNKKRIKMKENISNSLIKNIKDKKKEFKNTKEYYNFLLKEKSLKQATFAGGCFWCIEGPFEAQNGVVEAFSGYSGGNKKSLTYEEVSTGTTGAREVVEIFYDPKIISYEKLLEIFWRQIDPTDLGGQFADRGTHYTTAIYYRNENQKKLAEESKQHLIKSNKFSDITTLIIPFENFFLAEEYHQDYYKKSASHYQRYKKNSGREQNIKNNEKVLDKIFQNKYEKPSEAKIKSMLDDKSYAVTQKGMTEKPFDNAYWDNKELGIYVDIVTGEPLFSSTDKFDSGTGWPSFTKPIDENFISEHDDNKLAVKRTEVKSKIGGSHLGHVFNDGPKAKGGMRFCINSAALRFVPLDQLKDQGYEKYLVLFDEKN